MKWGLRVRHVHEVPVCSLHILMKRSYEIYNRTGTWKLSAWIWRMARINRNQKSSFQLLIFNIEGWNCNISFHEIIEGNFQLYKDSISLLIPLFFALDHPHYARWLPVRLHDMVMLQDNAPDVEKEFVNKKFVAKENTIDFHQY